MVSTERVIAYSQLEPEASLHTQSDSAKPPPGWPAKGSMQLSDVTYRHSPDGPLVLGGVSVDILPSEKVSEASICTLLIILSLTCHQIGIVGRTGAGKSSLIATLFRMSEPGGSIKIDGVECLSLGLHDIRNKISIIPQVCILYFTLRSHWLYTAWP